MQDPNLFSMPVWKGHKKSLAIETGKEKTKGASSETRRRYLSRPNGEPCTRVDCQMVGFLTKQCYKYETVLIDQASQMGFIYHQKTCSAEETIKVKRAFEKYAMNRGVTIQAYYADNGIFKAKRWMEECQQQKQNLTSAGVNAHNQNSIAKQRIEELQETTRAMLIHASKRWTGVVTIHLWPYAMQMANQAYNSTPLSSHREKQSPNKIFDNSAVNINPKHWKRFGCPVYILKAELQRTTGINPKWDPRSRASIYLGKSPIHNRNVALVLNIHTRYISLQSMSSSTNPSRPPNKTNGMRLG